MDHTRDDSGPGTLSSATQRFQTLFENVPARLLVLSPNGFEIIAVSNAYLAATMRSRDDLIGRTVFDAFPDDPADEGSDSTRILRSSLQRVMTHRAPDAMAVQRYPIPRPETEGGGFEQRYWSVVNTPLIDDDGSISCIFHEAEDVTPLFEGADDGQPTAHPTTATTTSSRPILEALLNTRRLQSDNRRLRAEIADLETVQRLLGLATWRLPVGLDVATLSSNFPHIIGTDPQRTTMSPHDYLQLVHEDDRERAERDLAVIETSGARHYESRHRIRRPDDGRIIYVHSVGELIDTPDGPSLVGLLQDVSSETRTRRELTRTNRLFALASRMARVGSWRVRRDRDHVIWSAETAAIHEVPVEPPPTLEKAFELYCEEYRPRIRAAVEHCFSTGEGWTEVLQIHAIRSGGRKWIRTIGEAEYDSEGNIIGTQGALQDISDLVHALDRGEALARRLMTTLENMSDAFYLLSGDLEFVYLNPLAEQLLERDRDTLIGRHVWDEFPAAKDSPLGEIYPRALQTGERQEARFHYPDLDKWFSLDAYPVPEGLAVYFRDITEQRQLDEQLRQAQKLESIGQLTGGVAHDFNNLLTVIVGNAELLREKLSDDRRLRPLADLIETAGARGAELTNRLLAFARRQPLAPQLVDLGKLIAGMEPLVRRTLSEDIEIEFVRGGGLWPCELDPGQLEVALLNLAINARDAMPEGGRLTIETANTRLDDAYADAHEEVSPGQYVMVSVTDSGLGMDEEALRRAFEPFYTTKAVGKGSGLGLSMVYGFVKQSNGHSKIYSEPGEGTTVRLYFPRSRSGAEYAAEADEVQVAAAGGEHVLVVEDDDLVRGHVVAQLEALGYAVTSAESGPGALELLRQSPDVDLLFTDVVMPGGMSGRDLGTAAQALRPSLRILYTSGYTENAIIHNGRLDPGVHLLSKPYRRRDLARKVRQVLDEPASPDRMR